MQAAQLWHGADNLQTAAPIELQLLQLWKRWKRLEARGSSNAQATQGGNGWNRVAVWRLQLKLGEYR